MRLIITAFAVRRIAGARTHSTTRVNSPDHDRTVAASR